MPGPSVDDVAAMLPVPNASGFQKGARLVVAYPLSDDPLLFRERVVLCRTICGSYLLLTPDRSITCESAGKIQIRQVRGTAVSSALSHAMCIGCETAPGAS